jgi:intracellular multiplication protein IcmJ
MQTPSTLVMSAKRLTWRMHDHAGEADEQFRAKREAVLDLADRRCAYCEFRAPKYQEVHHADDDHSNNADANLRCACPLCHQVYHLGLAGLHDGGEIIYCPEFSQVELNSLTLAIWLAAAGGGEYASGAQQVYEDLHNRNYFVTSIVRDWAHSANIRLQEPFRFTPDMLANVLMALPDAEYQRRADLLGGLRLLPKDIRFRDQIKHWVIYYGKALPATHWGKLVPDLPAVLARIQ